MRLASCSELASTVTVYRPRSVTSDAFAAALVGNDVMIDGLAVVHAEPEHRTRKDRKNRYALLRFEGGSLFSTHPTLAQKVLSLEKNEIAQQVRTKLGWPRMIQLLNRRKKSRSSRRGTARRGMTLYRRALCLCSDRNRLGRTLGGPERIHGSVTCPSEVSRRATIWSVMA